jgi:hypothetical protein
MKVTKDIRPLHPMMLIRAVLVFLLLALAITASLAQSSKKKKKNQPNISPEQSTTLEPYYPKKEYGPKISKRKSDKFFVYDAEKRYYERRAEVEKAKRKIEKQMMKPQFSDPSYFGHRKLPKKHKPKKMRFCRECGIRH